MVRYIVKCMNDKCNNYKMELNEGVEICSLCNEPAAKIETKVNRQLGMTAIIIAVASFIVYFGGGWVIGWMFNSFLLALIIQIGALAAMPFSLVLGIRSRSAAAIIMPIIFIIVGVGMFVWDMYWRSA